jgi:hypothetical protein
MTRLTWDSPNVSCGVDRGVYYPQVGIAEVWDGLVSVEETIADFESKPRYHDGQRILTSASSGCFAGTINTYSYPDGFYSNVLAKSLASSFGFSYRTCKNGVYKIHIVYNVLTVPSNFVFKPSAGVYSFPFTTLPVGSPELRSCSHIIIDCGVTYAETLAAIEDVLYGSGSVDPRLPTVTEIYSIYEENARLRVLDNGDGSCSITGPESAIQTIDSTSCSITWDSVVAVSSDTYTISSL